MALDIHPFELARIEENRALRLEIRWGAGGLDRGYTY